MKLRFDKKAEEIILNNNKIKLYLNPYLYRSYTNHFNSIVLAGMNLSLIYPRVLDLTFKYYHKYDFLFEDNIIRYFFYDNNQYHCLPIITMLSNTSSFLETQKKNHLKSFNTFSDVAQTQMDKLRLIIP